LGPRAFDLWQNRNLALRDPRQPSSLGFRIFHSEDFEVDPGKVRVLAVTERRGRSRCATTGRSDRAGWIKEKSKNSLYVLGVSGGIMPGKS
jgi:hypothetical protein